MRAARHRSTERVQLIVASGDQAFDAVSPPGVRPGFAVLVGSFCFIIDGGDRIADRLAKAGVALDCLQAILFTGVEPGSCDGIGECVAVWAQLAPRKKMRVIGPARSHRWIAAHASMSEHIRDKLEGLQPEPEPARDVIVFESGGLIVSAFTTDFVVDEEIVSYRFEIGGLRLVIAADRHASWAVAGNADLIVYGASRRGRRELSVADADDEAWARTLTEVAFATAGTGESTPVSFTSWLQSRGVAIASVSATPIVLVELDLSGFGPEFSVIE